MLGAGGSAEVWRGSITLPTGLEQECALKRLKGELATRPLYQHRLKRELEIGLAVTRDHPNLVTTQTCEVIAGRPTIVMELVVGSALSTIDARLDFDMIRYLATEVLAALAHLADKGVVHRDLSPANILIDHQGAVRVGDFGMATSRRPRARPRPTLDAASQRPIETVQRRDPGQPFSRRRQPVVAVCLYRGN